MRDVAKVVGCSLNTVSLTFHNHPSIPPATREKVRTAAVSIGYQFNPIVSSVMRQQKKVRNSETGPDVLAFLVSHPTVADWRSWPPLVRQFEGATARATECGFRLELVHARNEFSRKRLTGILWSRAIAGVLVAPLPHVGKGIELDWEKFAAVALGRSMLEPQIDRVSPAWFHAARETYARLTRVGHRRIGLLVDAKLDARSEFATRAVHADWLQQTTGAVAIPSLTDKASRPDRAKVVAWAKRHRISAIVSELIYEKRDRDYFSRQTKALWAYLSAPADDHSLCGMVFDHTEIGATAVDHLLAKLLYHRYGLPSRAHEILIEGEWRDGLLRPVH